jgi:superfamily II DNA or RNA helicase
MNQDKIKVTLLDYQRPAFDNLVRIFESKTGRAIDCSDTGSGKPYTACAVAAYSKLMPLIVCSESAVSRWRDVLQRTGCDYYGIISYKYPVKGRCPLGQKGRLDKERVSVSN